jgi:hypothetical protein
MNVIVVVRVVSFLLGCLLVLLDRQRARWILDDDCGMLGLSYRLLVIHKIRRSNYSDVVRKALEHHKVMLGDGPGRIVGVCRTTTCSCAYQ